MSPEHISTLRAWAVSCALEMASFSSRYEGPGASAFHPEPQLPSVPGVRFSPLGSRYTRPHFGRGRHLQERKMKKARCREEVAAGLISNAAREEVHRIQGRHRIWEE
ncbi:hypothetical protein MESS2_80126 [Mesorhizobium metallidurans STM 2683]|uniref:Uncharacterized protein n=1 Tax=Mesorhizobium metallidurans STM 2683 TaxID=1297569 RepID=M5EYF8_9HYPH|nr:hypothetical protein MESS2_80126 [Mesorhizobium metallidurans STM 2683]